MLSVFEFIILKKNYINGYQLKMYQLIQEVAKFRS